MFLLCFLPLPREGNSRLDSARFNYSSFYDMIALGFWSGAGFYAKFGEKQIFFNVTTPTATLLKTTRNVTSATVQNHLVPNNLEA